ncbi:hypothetical protein [Paenibacillus thiaminolyticus]|uniref:hypothetical protein n=1 Tax=Paenibacillus thiaminolyticus TaxID=49283 RepID=UPI003D6D0DC6
MLSPIIAQERAQHEEQPLARRSGQARGCKKLHRMMLLSLALHGHRVRVVPRADRFNNELIGMARIEMVHGIRILCLSCGRRNIGAPVSTGLAVLLIDAEASDRLGAGKRQLPREVGPLVAEGELRLLDLVRLAVRALNGVLVIDGRLRLVRRIIVS